MQVADEPGMCGWEIDSIRMWNSNQMGYITKIFIHISPNSWANHVVLLKFCCGGNLNAKTHIFLKE